MTSALEVDCTQLLLEILAPAALARVVTELPGALADAVPVLQVVRVGGPNDRIAIDEPTFVLHAFAASVPSGQKSANMLLHRAFAVLVAAIGTVVAVDDQRAVLLLVDSVSGPSPAPYENTNLRHSVSTIQARVRAA